MDVTVEDKFSCILKHQDMQKKNYICMSKYGATYLLLYLYVNELLTSTKNNL